MLTAKLEREGCEVIRGRGDINDTLPEIKNEVQKALNSADLVIITGGASEGEFDLVPAALRETGCQILCGQLEMKPGTHTTIAAKDNVLIFNLPGNPNAGSLLFEVLISPVLRKLRGMRNFNRLWFNIRLGIPTNNSDTLRLFCRGQLIDSTSGPEAMPLKRESRINGIASLVLDIAPGKGQKGDMVKALLV
jgi:molybdopterin molybdotransferase